MWMNTQEDRFETFGIHSTHADLRLNLCSDDTETNGHFRRCPLNVRSCKKKKEKIAFFEIFGILIVY